MKRAAEGGRDSSNHSHGGRSSKSRTGSIMVSCGGVAGHNDHKDKRRESKRVDVGGPAKTT